MFFQYITTSITPHHLPRSKERGSNLKFSPSLFTDMIITKLIAMEMNQGNDSTSSLLANRYLPTMLSPAMRCLLNNSSVIPSDNRKNSRRIYMFIHSYTLYTIYIFTVVCVNTFIVKVIYCMNMKMHVLSIGVILHA
jgi:hypothetical protein